MARHEWCNWCRIYLTRGNNVWARDFLGENSASGTSPDGGSTLIFDFPYGGTNVTASSYINAANTNFFI
jgi:hypothetical protein